MSKPSYRVVTVEFPPFVMFDNLTNTWYGFCIDLINEIRSIVKFDYTISQVGDNECGYVTNNGTWNGMIEELINDRADIALGPLWVTAERERVIDFTEAFYGLNGFSILIKKLKKPGTFYRFISILDIEIWITLFCAFFLTTMMLFLFERWSPFSYKNNMQKYENEKDERFMSLRECFWFTTIAATPQGGGETPKNLSGKLAAATWWVFIFIVIAVYMANLAATETLARLEKRILSFDDLIRQYKIEFSTVRNSPTHLHFQRMAAAETTLYHAWRSMTLNESTTEWERKQLAVWEYPIEDKYIKILQTMRESKFPENLNEAIDRIYKLNSSREFALVGESSMVKYLTMIHCDFKELGEEFSKRPYAIGLRKGSDLKSLIDEAIVKLHHEKVLEKLHVKWWQDNPMNKHCVPEEEFNAGLGLRDMGGMFVMIGVGIISSLIVLCVEFWWYWCYTRYKERKQRIFVKSKKEKF